MLRISSTAATRAIRRRLSGSRHLRYYSIPIPVLPISNTPENILRSFSNTTNFFSTYYSSGFSFSSSASYSTAATATSSANASDFVKLEAEAEAPRLNVGIGDAYAAIELALDSVVKIFTVSSSPNYFLPWQNKSQRETMGSGLYLYLTSIHNLLFKANVFRYSLNSD